MGWCVLRREKTDALIENVPMNSGLVLGKKREREREIKCDKESIIGSRDGASRMEKGRKIERDIETVVVSKGWHL